MAWLVGGIALFSIIHLSAALIPTLRDALKLAMGPGAFKAVFSALALAGIVMIVTGWRNTMPVAVYAPPAWGSTLAFLLMFVSVVLFGAAHAKTNIKRIVRHPQLSSVLLWSIAHLVSNGDSRSLILFGSLGVWAMIEMPLINRREGEWLRPARASSRSELIGAAISTVIFLVLIALHPYFAGVSPIPG